MTNRIKTSILPIIFAMMFPIIGFIIALIKPKSPYFRIVIIIFFTFVGFSYAYSFEGTDINSYLNSFHSALLFHGSFLDYFNSLSKETKIDFISPFLTWFISRFISNPRIFLAILSLLFGFFLANDVWFIVKRVNLSPLVILLLILLVCIPQIVAITHRWWLALLVFLFGLLPFICDKNPKRLFFCLLSVGIHFSFLYPLLILVLYLFLPKKNVLPYIVLFVLINFVDSLNLSQLSDTVSPLLPDSFNRRNESYIDSEILYHNLFSQLASSFFTYLNIISSIVLYIISKRGRYLNSSIINFFVICLLMGTFAALCDKTEWGWRFLDLSNFLFCGLYCLIISNNNRIGHSFMRFFSYLVPFVIFIIIFQIRGFLNVIGLKSLMAGNYVTMWLWDEHISVLSIIKQLF